MFYFCDPNLCDQNFYELYFKPTQLEAIFLVLNFDRLDFLAINVP